MPADWALNFGEELSNLIPSPAVTGRVRVGVLLTDFGQSSTSESGKVDSMSLIEAGSSTMRPLLK